MNKKLIGNVRKACLLGGLMSLLTVTGGFSQCLDASAAEPLDSMKVELTEETPATSEDTPPTVGGNFYDNTDELLNSLNAMNESEQISLTQVDDIQMFVADLDKDGNPDITYGIIEFGDMKAVSIAVLESYSITGAKSIQLTEASIQKAEAAGTVYVKQIDFVFPSGEHTHKWSTLWKSDADGHWHTCLNALCKTPDHQKDGFAAHTYGAWTGSGNDKSRSCTVCGYEQKWSAASDAEKSTGSTDSSDKTDSSQTESSSADSSGSDTGSSTDPKSGSDSSSSSNNKVLTDKKTRQSLPSAVPDQKLWQSIPAQLPQKPLP